MPYDIKTDIKNAKQLINDADAILIIAGAGMSTESGIPTYRGNNGIWERSIKIKTGEMFSYDEISSLNMWKTRPELAWGFKSQFYKTVNDLNPHEGYFELFDKIQKYDYFIATSNIDGYFERTGFDPNKIYEVHGSINSLQCMNKECNIRNGIYNVQQYPNLIPDYDEDLICKNLPICINCGENILRPNVSMFGDYEFYGKPYEYKRKKLNDWLANINKLNKKMIIIEIGCGINPHSLRMSNGKMMSGEWKMPIFENNIGTIRINPNDKLDDLNTIHLMFGAKKGIKVLFN